MKNTNHRFAAILVGGLAWGVPMISAAGTRDVPGCGGDDGKKVDSSALCGGDDGKKDDSSALCGGDDGKKDDSSATRLLRPPV